MNPPAKQEMQVQSLSLEDPMEEEMATVHGVSTHPSILAWETAMDRGAWWATVHGVAKESDTSQQLNNGSPKKPQEAT